MQSIADTYNKVAEDWHKDHLRDTWWQEGTDKFLTYLEPGSRIIDVGCAGGYKSQYLMERGMSVLGIDISKKFIEIAKREYPAGEFRVIDMNKIDQMREKFDAVFAQASILHLPKKEGATILKKFSDVLKPGGICFVSVKERRVDGVAEEQKTESDYGYDYTRLFSYYTEEDLRAYYEKAGFDVKDVWRLPVGRTVWLQIVGEKV